VTDLTAEIAQVRSEVRRIKTAALRGQVATLEGEMDAVEADIIAHAAAADPHPGYVLESVVPDFALLDEQAGAGGSASVITFSSIPQTHRDLMVVLHGNHTGTVQRAFTMRFNSDTGANYRWVFTRSIDNVAPARSSGIGVTSIQVGDVGDDGRLTVLRADIVDYTLSANKAVVFQNGFSVGSAAGDSGTSQGWGTHVNGSPLTTIELIVSTDAWATTTLARLYGIGAL
jgi:hypothetical protein